MVHLLLSTGRSDGVRVHDVVGTLSYYADIPGRSLGKGANYRIGNKAVTVQRA